MAQQVSSMQTGTGNADMNSALGNLQSVGPSNPPAPALNTLQSNNTVQTLQAQTQPPQASFASHPTKVQQAQQSSMSSSSTDFPQFLTKTRLQDLVREVDPTEQLDEEVEEILLQLADDFVETTVNAACLLAKHRHANTVEVKDVQLHLERNWNMWIPGFGTDEVRPYKRATVTEAHKQRLALIRKSIKKY
ncbi:transcription initiation factor TFIID subunit 12 isoform X2 [Cephus cinctus]|nr:transcription initiation factor TFIID subunit 12 isoform X2 [Cephus cinctus]XP_015606972.1 transcription initiation factor TFIID subunit 12 isoform X2 [Cephus cinctus]XP_024946454.1 transcription initiation factor TFIID subunit 12 isoform X2 [Cephus cinctus]